jgi:hypothetical protein
MTDLDPEPQHVYEARRIPDMSSRFFRVGDGSISGYVSIGLGVLSVFAVLCFRYPSYLTTRELREVYDPEVLRLVLKGAMWTALGFGVLTFALNKKKRLGAIGMLCTLLAFAVGGYGIEAGPVAARPLSVGLDWFVLNLLLTAAGFIFIEKVASRPAVLRYQPPVHQRADALSLRLRWLHQLFEMR